MHLFLNSKNPISCLPPSVIKGFASTFTSCLCSAPPHLHSPMFRFGFFFLSLCLSDTSGCPGLIVSRLLCVCTALVQLHQLSFVLNRSLCFLMHRASRRLLLLHCSSSCPEGIAGFDVLWDSGCSQRSETSETPSMSDGFDPPQTLMHRLPQTSSSNHIHHLPAKSITEGFQSRCLETFGGRLLYF